MADANVPGAGGSSGADSSASIPPALDAAAGKGTPPATHPADAKAAPILDAAAFASLQKQVADLTALNVAAEGKAAKAATDAEAARVAGLSDLDKLRESLATTQADLSKQAATLVDDARKIAAERLGVLPKFLQYVPAVDPRNADGAAQIEAWAKANPELLAPRGAGPNVAAFAPVADSPLAKIISGAQKNALISIDSIRKMTGAR